MVREDTVTVRALTATLSVLNAEKSNIYVGTSEDILGAPRGWRLWVLLCGTIGVRWEICTPEDQPQNLQGDATVLASMFKEVEMSGNCVRHDMDIY